MKNLSPAQKNAIFEKLRNKATGGINPTPKTPREPSLVHPKMIAPIAPPQMNAMPPAPGGMNPAGVNQNLVGNPRAQRFARMKRMLGI